MLPVLGTSDFSHWTPNTCIACLTYYKRIGGKIGDREKFSANQTLTTALNISSNVGCWVGLHTIATISLCEAVVLSVTEQGHSYVSRNIPPIENN